MTYALFSYVSERFSMNAMDIESYRSMFFSGYISSNCSSSFSAMSLWSLPRPKAVRSRCLELSARPPNEFLYSLTSFPFYPDQLSTDWQNVLCMTASYTHIYASAIHLVLGVSLDLLVIQIAVLAMQLVVSKRTGMPIRQNPKRVPEVPGTSSCTFMP